MSLILTDDPSTFEDVAVPQGGDARNATSLLSPFQRLANRTRQNKNRLDGIAPGDDGVRSLRTVATIAALQAIGAADHTDGSYCIVEEAGLYRFDIDSVTAASTPFVVQPTDVVGGAPGRWHLLAAGEGVLNTANGIPQCDATGRVPAPRVRNGVIHSKAMLGFLAGSTAGTLGSVLLLPGLAVGDLLTFQYSAKLMVGAGNTATVQANVVDPVAGVNLVTGTVKGVTIPSGATVTDGTPVASTGFYNIVNNGDHSLYLYGSANLAMNFFDVLLTALVIRP